MTASPICAKAQAGALDTMSASIFSLNSLRLRKSGPASLTSLDWTQQELAELYRVRDRLTHTGLAVAVETGLTDEREPWAVFVHGETGDAFVHIARLDGDVVVANLTANVIYRGRDFRAITDQMLAAAPLVMPRSGPADRKVVMHPRSVFTAFVAAAIVLSEFLRSIEPAKAAGDHDKAVADTKAMFPQMFERIIARDAGWAPTGVTASAVALISAAVGAVAMGDHPGSLEDDDDAHPRTTVADTLDLRIVPTAVIDNKQAAVEKPSLDTTQASLATDEEQAGGYVQAVGDRVAKTEDASAGRTGDGSESVPQTSVASQQPHGLAFGDFGVVHEEAIAPRIIRATAAAPVADDSGTASSTSVASPAPSTSANETPSSKGPDAQAKDIAVIVDAIVVARIPAGSSASSQVKIAIDHVVEDQPATVVPAASQQNSPSTTGESKATATKIDTAGSEWLLHTKVTDASRPTLVGGVHDVVLISEKTTVIHGFRFNEDYLLVDGSIDRTDWIKTVEINGDDVKITSVTGAVISLIDTHGLIA